MTHKSKKSSWDLRSEDLTLNREPSFAASEYGMEASAAAAGVWRRSGVLAISGVSAAAGVSRERSEETPSLCISGTEMGDVSAKAAPSFSVGTQFCASSALVSWISELVLAGSSACAALETCRTESCRTDGTSETLPAKATRPGTKFDGSTVIEGTDASEAFPANSATFSSAFSAVVSSRSRGRERRSASLTLAGRGELEMIIPRAPASKSSGRGSASV